MRMWDKDSAITVVTTSASRHDQFVLQRVRHAVTHTARPEWESMSI
jgi:hypothetical protein